MRALFFLLLLACACTRGKPSQQVLTPPRLVACPTPYTDVQVLPFDPEGDGDPGSLFWSEKRKALLIADQRGNRIWSWTEQAGFALLGKTSGQPADPSGAARDEVGQIVELSSGRILVARFGFGTHGGIAYLDPNGESGVLPGLDPKPRRLGLAVTEAGVFCGTFAPSDKGMRGAITKLTERGEKKVASGFNKPVGMLQVGRELWVVDQARAVIGQSPGVVVALPLDGDEERLVASVPEGDLLAYGPNDTLFTGQFKSQSGELAVRQICSSTYAQFDGPLTHPSGIAYDPEGQRLFVADSDGKDVRTIRIYSLLKLERPSEPRP